MKLASHPHLVDVSDAPEKLQMEFIEMSGDNILKALFDEREKSHRNLGKCGRIDLSS